MRAQEAWYLARQAERGFASRLRGLLPLATVISSPVGLVPTNALVFTDFLSLA
jgi:hypothetical protein